MNVIGPQRRPADHDPGVPAGAAGAAARLFRWE